ncbi:MAG TPA: ATP-binding protein [Vicinamibacterales bacterium]|nr:ATP-binding protein [Vicinamibacterales bacterium]
MTISVRLKLFIGSMAAAVLAVMTMALLVPWQLRAQERTTIERRLTDESKLIADLLSSARDITEADMDREADRLGTLVAGRVTLIAGDGRVVGDSAQTPAELPALENHASRPEVLAATGGAVGISQRYSTTVQTDMVYVAIRSDHPVVKYVRLALPLTDVNAQLATIGSATVLALVAALVAALILSWVFSAPLARRVEAVAAVAQRYSAGDFSRPAHDYGEDELGAVARTLDAAAQELGRKIDDLSRDRARTEAILAGMVEGVLIVDRQGRVQLVNRAAQDMLRVTEQATGRPYVEVIRHPDIASLLGASLRREPMASRELTLARDASRTFVARAAAVASSGDGGAVLVLHDITDLRKAGQIRQDFVANVSHELRTPLTAISGYVEALLDEPSLGPDARGFLDIIGRHTARMERLVKDLLRLARLDARQEPLERTRCGVRDAFDAVVADLSPSVEARQSRVTIEIPGDAAYVDADPGKLHDILRNLVENAVNYSPLQADIHLSAERHGASVHVIVSDSGPGIPPNDLTRVFERFYRVDKSRSGPGGTGLGLSIVKHLVELHDGQVSVGNRHDGGAVFTVVLPDA